MAAHPHAPYPLGDFMFRFLAFDVVEVWNGLWTSHDPSGIVFTVVAATSGMGRECIRDRTLEGHESARKRGTIGGARGVVAALVPFFIAERAYTYAVASLLSSVAQPVSGALTNCFARTRAADLPFVHSVATGLQRDRTAVDAALTLPHHNGRTEGVNCKIKRLERQRYGRAGHPLLRRLILLN